LELERSFGCQLQVGGSDQLGNMLGGIDLIRRVRSRPAWALAWPLLTAADGTKLGKTTGARIWLDPDKTSPYQFFQHWMATDDRQVRQFLLQFTLLPVSEVDALVKDHLGDPGRRIAQRRLGEEATLLVHGAHEAATAVKVSELLFGADPTTATEAQLLAIGREAPSVVVDGEALGEGLELATVLALEGFLAASRGEARRAIAQGGVYVNGRRAADGEVLGTGDLLQGRFVLLRKGKKAYGLVDTQPGLA